MTWKSTMFAALALSIAGTPTSVDAQDVYAPQTQPVMLDPEDSDALTLGELEYRGGLQIEAGEGEIGGVSGLEWSNGQLYAVTDDGRWLVMTTDEIGDRLIDLIEIETGPLLDQRGKRLRRKSEADAEAVARDPSGDWIVTFEMQHRVWRYPAFDQPAEPADLPVGSLLEASTANGGLETLAFNPDGWIACGEWAAAPTPNCISQTQSEVIALDIAAPPPLDERGGAPTDAGCASNGVCFVLFRSYTPDKGNAISIVAIGPDGLKEILATWTPPLSIDNFEGLAVREQNGQTYLYIISDNNFSDSQRTLLMKFKVSDRAATTPGVPEKVYATTTAIIETSLGEIIVKLETERAPITAANFLRYIDENRYDGTRCYRAMRVQGGKQPSGFLQCGTQNHPDRIIDPIAHEPTNQTGLSHTNGALSMARFEPGTATGDFSIMIEDQRGLDANPDAEDPAQRPGFAVFGYVIGGMDVVHAIHATRIDPEQGEGFLKGQMLAEPVEIIDIRRMEPQPVQ
jgi:cyclophilin family peptidyl-prolyl cis-trans isomerase